jgi:hypothetical protein
MPARTLGGDGGAVNDAHVARHGVTSRRAPCTYIDPDDESG